MPAPARDRSVLKFVARPLIAVLWFTFIVFFRPIAWALAMLFVGLCCGACVSDLSVWPAIVCFAAMIGQHLVPVEPIERYLGLQKKRDRV